MVYVQIKSVYNTLVIFLTRSVVFVLAICPLISWDSHLSAGRCFVFDGSFLAKISWEITSIGGCPGRACSVRKPRWRHPGCAMYVLTVRGISHVA